MLETETRVARRFDVWNEVPLVPQLTGMSCWAAAAAMIIGWRDSIFVDPQEVASGSGTWESYRAGLHPADVDTLARAWGLAQERPGAWTAEALRRVLARHGPVWLGEASPGLHSIVVAGMHGDGTPEGTWVRINDPWPVGRGERYTLPWNTLAANFRRAGDLIGVQAHVLHAGGRRGSSRSRVRERRTTRSRISIPAIAPREEAMTPVVAGVRHRHHEEYDSVFGAPAAGALGAVAAGEKYLNTATTGGTNPLASHGGRGENLYLVWNDIPDNVAVIDVVVHLHGYRDRADDGGLTRFVAGLSGMKPKGRARPTLGIVPRGRKITKEEFEAKWKVYEPRKKKYDEELAKYKEALEKHRADPRAAPKPKAPREPWKPRDDVFTFPALLDRKGEGLSDLVKYALGWFSREVLGRAAPPPAGRCILTAHSGGGAALDSLLAFRDVRRICNPEEVHTFDALYGDADNVKNIKAWATARIQADRDLVKGLTGTAVLDRLREKGGGLRVLYRGGTSVGSNEVAAVLPPASDPLQQAYRVEATTWEHDEVPGKFGPDLLRDVRASIPLDPPPKPRPAKRAPARGHAFDYAHEPEPAYAGVGSYPYGDGFRPGFGGDGYGGDGYGGGRYGYVGYPYGFVEALSVDDDVRAWLAAAPAARAPHASAVAAWIADTGRSGIELIADAARRSHFLSGVDWSKTDFPGNDQNRSREPSALFDALAVPVPERRVTAIRYRDVDFLVQPVPDETRHRLYPDAKDAYVRMRDAARADGVALRIGSAWRSLATQRSLAAKNSNPNAVAQRVSAHCYGLAIDLLLSVSGLAVREITTRPMSNVIAMYRSPVYKWMALRAREFGFFPYRREPWHWEFNPDGFRARFEAGGRSASAHAYGAPIALLERYASAMTLDAPAPAPSGRDLTGPLADDEWRRVAMWTGRGEVGIRPLTGDAEQNATVVAGSLFCSRKLFAQSGGGEDPLLCVIDEVTHADPRVRALRAHVTARGAIVNWAKAAADARILYVMERLVDRYAFPVNGAAGLVGNLWAESGVIPSRIEGSAIDTPLRAPALEGGSKDFTADEVMSRDTVAKKGPRKPGIGLAQWTSAPRRQRLFRHVYDGRPAGSSILFDMDAQVDFLVAELRDTFPGVYATLTRPTVTMNDAADDVVYRFEVPGSILHDRKLLPRADARVQAVFRGRRASAQRALRVYRAAHPAP